MADDDDDSAWTVPDSGGDTTTAPAPAAAPPGVDLNALIKQIMGGGAPPAAPAPAPADSSGGQSIASLLGEAVAGGEGPLNKLSGAAREQAGIRSLMGFGAGLLSQSGYHNVRVTAGEALAAGVQGAQAAMDRAQQEQYVATGTQQQLAQQQQQNQLARIKTALPLLTLQAQMGRADALKTALLGGGGGTPGAPGAAPGGGDYGSAILGLEGSGANPNSSAKGAGQFIDSTWNAFVAANPDTFKGMTPQQIAAARNDPRIGAQAVNWYAQQNAGALSGAGITPTGQGLGVAHFLGPGDAVKVLAAPDNAPLAGLVQPASLKANPELAKMTVGDLKKRYAGVPNPSFLGGSTPPGAPAPYKVASNAPVPPPGGRAPPSGQGGAPGAAVVPGATTPPPAVPVGNLGLVRNPDGSVGTPGGGGLGTGAGAPGAVPGAAPGAPGAAPPAVPGAPTTPPTPKGPLEVKSFEEYQAQHPFNPPPEIASTFNVAPDAAQLANLQQQEARYQAVIANSIDPKEIATATTAINKVKTDEDTLRQNAINQGNERRVAAYKDWQAGLRQSYDKAHEIAQQQAGTLGAQQQNAQLKVDTSTLDDLGKEATTARGVMGQLQQLSGILPNLPSGAIGAVLQRYPDAAALLNHLGLSDQATAAQLLQGATGMLSVGMRPVGSGPLRGTEMAGFKAALPHLLETPEGQKQALSQLMNLYQRHIDEANFARQYFQQNGNLSGMDDAMNAKPVYDPDTGVRVGGGLPPVVLRPPPQSAPLAAHQAYQKQVQANVQSGFPYYTWQPKVNNVGAPVLGRDGRQVYEQQLRVMD